MSRYLTNLTERVAGSAGAAFLGVELANGADITSLSVLHAAGVAALTAAATVVYGVLAKFVGDPETASLLPRRAGRQ